ncbi:MAG: UDP-3-O-(3-hydroxymyristoyl)glucosamine N-acyltransferase [Nitrospirota bacterium]
MKLNELAEKVGGRVLGDPEVEITGVSGIDEAKEGDITFFSDKRMMAALKKTKASAVILKEELGGLNENMLIVDNPQLVFAKVLEVFYKKPYEATGVSDKAVIGENASIGEDVSIYPSAYIGSDVTLGARVTVSPGAYIGDKVYIGDDSYIHPNVTVRENVKIGNNVTVHSGTVIGCDGFGYIFDGGEHFKIPQVGGVFIEDDVEIGANVIIDRATVGSTVIGAGTKIDNLVQIAHNVKIGKKCIIAAQVGISGSVEIGDGAVFAGKVGVRDHVKIGSGAMLGAGAGVVKDIPDNQIYSGSPALPHKTWLRAQSIYSKLPEYIRRLQKIEQKINPVDNSTNRGKKEGNSDDE